MDETEELIAGSEIEDAGGRWWKLGRKQRPALSAEELAAEKEKGASVKVAEAALKQVQKEQDAFVKAAEKGLRKAEQAYADRVKAAEKALKDTRRSVEKRIHGANDAIAKAQEIGTRRLDCQGSLRLYEDRIETPEGVARFLDGPVKATVDTAGNLAVTKRATLTRVATGGLLLGPLGAVVAGAGFKKGKKIDTRELYVLIEAPGFVSVAQFDPDKGPNIRSFAARVSTASLAAPQLADQRVHAVAQAQTDYQTAQFEGQMASAQAEAALNDVRQDEADVRAASAELERIRREAEMAVGESQASVANLK